LSSGSESGKPLPHPALATKFSLIKEKIRIKNIFDSCQSFPVVWAFDFAFPDELEKNKKDNWKPQIAWSYFGV